MPLALRALGIITQLGGVDVCVASYQLFRTIMASNDLTDQHWEAARLAAPRATQRGPDTPFSSPGAGRPKEILKFLDYHLGLYGAGEDHGSSIDLAFGAIIRSDPNWYNPWVQHLTADSQTVECIRDFNCTSPSFVKGMRLIMRPKDPLGLHMEATRLISLVSDQWFDSPVPIMEPEEMSEFCEHLAVFMVDGGSRALGAEKSGVTILFGMLRSPEWRKHIVTRLWSVFAYCRLIEEEQESFRWCLRNAIELLEFTRGLPDGEGLKRWYVTLWLHYDKLDTTVRDEAEKIARDVSLSDGSSDQDSYLNLIRREVTRIKKGLYHWWNKSDTSESCMVPEPLDRPRDNFQGVYRSPSCSTAGFSPPPWYVGPGLNRVWVQTRTRD